METEDGYELTCFLNDTFTNEELKTVTKPMMFLDLLWNMSFIIFSVAVLSLAVGENPSFPLRIWVYGYILECVFHVGFIFIQYRKVLTFDWDEIGDLDFDLEVGVDVLSPSYNKFRFLKRVETMNSVVSSLWWVLGFYWIVMGGQALMQESPRLYWLTVVYLAFDVFFVLFCLAMACVALLAFFCCLPVLAVAYAVGRKGASEEDIRCLPKYIYSQDDKFSRLDNSRKQEKLQTGIGSQKTDCATELALLPEDSECCICLSSYADGVELYRLPCSHHFHCDCISKWLKINAICPLCKFNIRRGDTLV